MHALISLSGKEYALNKKCALIKRAIYSNAQLVPPPYLDRADDPSSATVAEKLRIFSSGGERLKELAAA